MKFLLVLLFVSGSVYAQTSKKPSVRYEYKKVERFDFAEIGVEGESGSPGDLSIVTRARKEFTNRLPEKLNFNKELKKSINGIR